MKKQTAIIIVVAVLVLVIACNIACCIGGLVAGGALSMVRTHRYERITPQAPMERWRMEPTPQERSGVAIAALVVDVAEEGPAAEAGIEVGDRILALDGERLQRGTAPREMLSAYKPGDRVELTIQRGERTREVQVTLGSREDSDLPRLGLTYRIVPFMRGTE